MLLAFLFYCSLFVFFIYPLLSALFSFKPKQILFIYNRTSFSTSSCIGQLLVFWFTMWRWYWVVSHVSIYLQLLWILDLDGAVALSSFVSRVTLSPVLLQWVSSCGFLSIIFRVQFHACI
jgi:hypothetical protein